MFKDGSSVQQVLPLPPESRTSVPISLTFPAAANRRFGAIIESDGVSLVVERAMYSSPGNITWMAGTAAIGMPFP